MKKYDTNGDGMLSKDEFMKMHEAMFKRMKGANGMVTMNNIRDTGALYGHDGTRPSNAWPYGKGNEINPPYCVDQG